MCSSVTNSDRNPGVAVVTASSATEITLTPASTWST
jgi:hypothetical protein